MIGCARNWRASNLATVGAGLALCATACGGRQPAAPSAEEPVLNVYNWADYVGHDTIAEFERRTREAAHKFLNFILEPQVIAEITNDIHYGNDNLAARPFVHSELLGDPAVYPPPELRARLYLPAELGPDYDRLRTRVWTHIKTGQ
jgi:spermidine/putrescine-binding protein